MRALVKKGQITWNTVTGRAVAVGDQGPIEDHMWPSS